MEKPPIIVGIMSSIITLIFEILLVIAYFKNKNEYNNAQLMTIVIGFVLLTCGLVYFIGWTIQRAKEIRNNKDDN